MEHWYAPVLYTFVGGVVGILGTFVTDERRHRRELSARRRDLLRDAYREWFTSVREALVFSGRFVHAIESSFEPPSDRAEEWSAYVRETARQLSSSSERVHTATWSVLLLEKLPNQRETVENLTERANLLGRSAAEISTGLRPTMGELNATLEDLQQKLRAFASSLAIGGHFG